VQLGKQRWENLWLRLHTGSTASRRHLFSLPLRCRLRCLCFLFSALLLLAAVVVVAGAVLVVVVVGVAGGARV